MPNPFFTQLGNKSFASGVSKGLDKVLPLMLLKNRIKQGQDLLNLKKSQLLVSGAKTLRDLKINAIKTQFDIISKQAQEATKAQDQPAYQSAMERSQSLVDKLSALQGVPPVSLGGVNVAPMEEAPETMYRMPGLPAPKTIDESILRETKGDIQRAIDLKQKLMKPSALRPVVMPDNKVRWIPNNQVPPKGAVPYSSGMNLELDKAGNLRLQTGVPGIGIPETGKLGKKLTDTIKEKKFEAIEGLKRISDIIKNMKPEFLEIPTKLGIAWDRLNASFGAKLPKEKQDRLIEFKAFKDDALSNINLYIEYITGAQMNKDEAKRIRSAMPDPGEYWWSGDDPVTFRGGLLNIYRKLRASIVRYNLYLDQGMDEGVLQKLINEGQLMSIEEVQEKIQNRGNEIGEEIKKQNPNIATQNLMELVLEQLKKEFRGFN